MSYIHVLSKSCKLETSTEQKFLQALRLVFASSKYMRDLSYRISKQCATQHVTFFCFTKELLNVAQKKVIWPCCVLFRKPTKMLAGSLGWCNIPPMRSSNTPSRVKLQSSGTLRQSKAVYTWILQLWKYSPITESVAVAVAFPAIFSATQRYTPVCRKDSSAISITEPLYGRGLLFRNQRIRGIGKPLATHSMRMESPTSTVMFGGGLIISGETKWDDKKRRDIFVDDP